MHWTPPSTETLFDVLDATWPAAAKSIAGQFTIRDGAGGGQRVSAATLNDPNTRNIDLSPAIDAMKRRGAVPLFMVRTGEDALDRALDDAGFAIKDPVVLYACPARHLADMEIPEISAIPCAAPVSRQLEIWAEGGIGPKRIDVMRRAVSPKTFILGRMHGRPTGTAFVAVDQGIAMLHALEVAPKHRRTGSGRAITIGAAQWAAENDAPVFALMTTTANAGANGLYQRLGMTRIAEYHYRIAPQ